MFIKESLHQRKFVLVRFWERVSAICTMIKLFFQRKWWLMRRSPFSSQASRSCVDKSYSLLIFTVMILRADYMERAGPVNRDEFY